jgi:hypothetical protein
MEWLIALWVLSGVIGYAVMWLQDLDLTVGGAVATLLFGPIPGPIWLLWALVAWIVRGRRPVVLIRRFRD